MDIAGIQEVIDEITDHPQYSWPAHIDHRAGAVYWGSDFICYVRPNVSPEQVRAALVEYIDTRMQVR